MTNDMVRVAAVAMHSEMGDPEANLSRLEEWTRKAHAEGAAFALFTEECITGSMNKSDHLPDEGMIVVEVSREAIRRARASMACTVDTARPEVYSEPVLVG